VTGRFVDAVAMEMLWLDSFRELRIGDFRQSRVKAGWDPAGVSGRVEVKGNIARLRGIDSLEVRRMPARGFVSRRMRNDVQGAASALGAGSVQCGVLLVAQYGAEISNGSPEMDATEGKCLASVATGKQSEVTDLDEACRQDVEQEAADELGRIESHDTAAAVMPGVAPAEANLAVFKAEKSSVRDGDPMRVACQVLEHMFRSSNRGLE
jgi:hypothetical protein